MNYFYLKAAIIVGLSFRIAHANEICDVTLRFHKQWEVKECEKKVLGDKYGPIRVSFDPQGRATPQNLPSHLLTRWKSLYEICMRDGCYFCDADEGSCEMGTCGTANAKCKPYMTLEGHPQCGMQCADFAFMSTLP